MSKAIQGAAMLAGAVAMGAAAFVDPVLVASPIFDKIWLSLIVGGISMEAGAIASALSSNRGTGITTRQPAAYRQIIYGTQRVGGVIVFRSTTGSHHDQYNMVIILADHPCEAILNLYLDGRQVFWKGSGPGYTVRNGIGFGGNADSSDHTDQGNNKYNFGSLVYCEARYGDQAPGDVISGLTANDPTWAAKGGQSPYLGQMTYVYLKIEYDQKMFPSFPEIKFTVQGKNDIYDPRTAKTGYTDNWALCVADVLTNPEWGVGEDQANINTAQLIAAANVCDTQIPLASGMTERQWTCNSVFDTGTSPGDMLDAMMPAAQGRLSYVSGEWYIWPAYWQGPSFTFDQTHLLKDFNWNAGHKIRERYNRVKGTYTAPNFPYTVAGNLYDGNGFYESTRQDNFNFEWMRTDAPYYAEDPDHGYPSDQWLAADNGKERWLDIQHHCVISIATCQRTFKVALLRNRIGGGTTTLVMGMEAYQLVPMDVIQLSYAPWGWVNKPLEVTSVQLSFEPVDDGKAMAGTVIVQVQETDPSIYSWSVREELNVFEQPAVISLYGYQVQPPTNLDAVDVDLNLVRYTDGVAHPRALVTWTPAADATVVSVNIQQMVAGTTQWIDLGNFSNSAGFMEMGVIPLTTYLIRARGLTASGAASSWEQITYVSGPFGSQVSSGGLSGGLNPNAPNNATIDSVVTGSTCTIRIYGPGGVGSSITQNLGSLGLVLPAGQITGQPLNTTEQCYWDQQREQYLINPPPNDHAFFVGAVHTVGSGGTGGTPGGGGSSPGGGGLGCTIRGTVLISDHGEESNEAIAARFSSGEAVYLKGRHGLEKIVSLEWLGVPHYQFIEVDGFRPFGCSDSHTMLPEGSDHHTWCSLIDSGTKVDTTKGFHRIKRTWTHSVAEVLKIELEGPSHEYLVEDGVWAHNVKPLNPAGL